MMHFVFSIKQKLKHRPLTISWVFSLQIFLMIRNTCLLSLNTYVILFIWLCNYESNYGTHRKNTPSSKNPALTKFMKIDVWVIDALSRPFLRGSHTQTKFLRNKLLVAKLRSFWYVRFVLTIQFFFKLVLAVQFCMQMLRFNLSTLN